MVPSSRPTPSRLITKDAARRGRSTSIVLFLAGLLFLAIGSVGTYFVLIAPILRTMDAQTWSEASCQITESFLETSSGDDGDTYRPAVRYRFTFNDRSYTGDKFDFSEMYSGGREGQQHRLDTVPVGAKVACYVNSDNPSESVIYRDLGYGIILPGLLVLLFPLAGLGMLYAGFKTGFSGGTKSNSLAAVSTTDYLAPSISVAANSGEKMLGIAKVTEGPLTHESSPMLRLIGALLIAAFWNGLVSFFLFQFIADWNSGSIEWVLALILVPFTLVGIGLLVFVGYSILGLFNPRISIEISPHPQALSGPIQVAWKIKRGSVASLKDLVFSLEGKEVARYRRGTDTVTDTQTFYTKELRSVSATEVQMRQGRFQFSVPENLVPSLSVPNNEIVWALKCHGRIDRWPDISEDMPFTVFPLRR